MVCIALLPTYEQVGAWAGWGLILMRCLMGFSVGGEYTAVVTYLFESAPAHRRGLITSLAAAASEVGGLLAVGLCAILTGSLDSVSLDGWGWRVPFLFGAALAGAIWLLRGVITETPAFHSPAAGQPSPLAYALRHERKGIATGFAISALGSISYYVGITYVPSYMASVGWHQEGVALQFSTLAALVVIAVTPLVGWLSDVAGRKAILLALCAGCAVLPMAMFKLVASGSTPAALAAIAALAALAGGVSAVGTVATAEQFSARARLSGLALGATSATAVFGGLTPYLAHRWQQASGLIEAPGIMIAIVALASGVALAFLLPNRGARA
jgi:MHS family proline/betaine transporter-like MFS transporter